jgi:hypothetical protein
VTDEWKSVRIQIPDANLTIELPGMSETERASLQEIMRRQTKLSDQLNTLSAIQEFHLLTPDGPRM